MSNATLSPIEELEAELNSTVVDGRIIEAFDRFYADDVVMQENAASPISGKAANRERELQFVASIEQVHGVRWIGGAVAKDRSYSEWELDVTFKGGLRVKLEQVAARRWRDGKVVHERFYYNAANA